MKGKGLSLGFLSSCRASIFFNATSILLLALVTPFAHAQSTGGRIRGTVTDPSGGAVVGATVTLINEIGRAPSELQSQSNLVCRLLLEKKKKDDPSGNHLLICNHHLRF